MGPRDQEGQGAEGERQEIMRGGLSEEDKVLKS